MQTYDQAIDYLTATKNIDSSEMSPLMFKFLRHAARFAAHELDKICCDANFVPVIKKMLFTPAHTYTIDPRSCALRELVIKRERSKIADPFNVVELFSTKI